MNSQTLAHLRPQVTVTNQLICPTGNSTVQYNEENIIKRNLFRRIVVRYYKIVKRNQYPDISTKYEDLEMTSAPQNEKSEKPEVKNYNKGKVRETYIFV